MILIRINVIKLFILNTKLKHLNSVIGTQNTLFVVVVVLTFIEPPFFFTSSICREEHLLQIFLSFCKSNKIFCIKRETRQLFNNLNMIIYINCKQSWLEDIILLNPIGAENHPCPCIIYLYAIFWIFIDYLYKDCLKSLYKPFLSSTHSAL